MKDHEDHSRSRENGLPMTLMAREHYAPYRWVQAASAILALWLITSPFAFGYENIAMTISDVASGTAVLALAVLALSKRRGWASWFQAFIGVWLLLAPLVFWGNAAAYANDTLAGAALIAFAFLIPMGMEMEGRDVPPGWSYNPSSWPQRAPAIALAIISFFIARHMAAYQLGYIDRVWDPFFGAQTEKILSSDVSRAWPVSDAGLGAATYMIEALMGLMGDGRRWRTMPWMVAIFGFVVVPLGVVSIVLVIMQPLAVGAWCSPCLLTAALMLAMIPLSIDEIVAMIQFIRRKKREGVSAWRTFWLGGDLADDEGENAEVVRGETWRPRGMVYGVTAPWPLVLSIAIGLWLMFAPAVLGIEGVLADMLYLIGPLIIVVAAIALAEVARPARFLNIPLALVLSAGVWFFEASPLAHLVIAISGLIVIALSMPLGTIRERYGTFDRAVRCGPTARDRRRRPPRRNVLVPH
jgi:hypothetical protein